MAAPPATPHAAASPRAARLPGAASPRASRSAAAFFPSRRTRLTAAPSMHPPPTHSDSSFLLSFRLTQPAARAGAGPSRCLAVPAAVHRNKLMGSLTNAEGLRFGVVVARFNEVVTNLLLQGGLETFERYSVKPEDITVVSVPGSFEVPITAQSLGSLENLMQFCALEL